MIPDPKGMRNQGRGFLLRTRPSSWHRGVGPAGRAARCDRGNHRRDRGGRLAQNVRALIGLATCPMATRQESRRRLSAPGRDDRSHLRPRVVTVAGACQHCWWGARKSDLQRAVLKLQQRRRLTTGNLLSVISLESRNPADADEHPVPGAGQDCQEEIGWAPRGLPSNRID